MSRRPGQSSRRANGKLIVPSPIVAFGPSTISGMLLWWKADAGVSTSGSTVTAVLDQSGNGRNATSISGTTLATGSTIGGASVFRFAGSGWVENNTLSTPEPVTIYAVANETHPGSGLAGLWDNISGNFNHFDYYYSVSDGLHHQEVFSYGATSPGTAFASTGEVICGQYDVAAGNPLATYRQNSTTPVASVQAGTPTNTSSMSGFMLGSVSGNPTGHNAGGWIGDVAETIVYFGYHTQAQRQTVFAYLGGRYGITVT